MLGYIYLIRNNINGKGYIGQTVRHIKKRFENHLYDSKNGSGVALHKAIRKYGSDNFTITTVVSCEEVLLDDMEAYYIEFYGTFAPIGHGYNLTKGGDSAPRSKRSAEHCAKLSAAKLGKKLSLEHRSKLSEVRAGVKRKPCSTERKLKISLANKGKRRSDKERAAMSLARMGNKNRKGIPHSSEVKGKIRASMLVRRSENPHWGHT